MTRRGPRRARPARTGPGAWDRIGWPVLAGAVGTVGLLGACPAFGPVGLLFVTVTITLLAAVVAWGLGSEVGITRPVGRRLVLGAAPVVLVLAGLTEELAAYGLLVAAVVVVTWPPVLRRLRRRRQQAGGPQLTRSGVLLDPLLVDRRFEDIVRELRATGDFPQV